MSKRNLFLAISLAGLLTATSAGSLALARATNADRDVGTSATDEAAAKKCPKGKKKCPKPPKPAACRAFEPGEAGQGQPTVVLTDAATEQAPAKQTVTLARSTANVFVVGGDPSFAYFNIQVDSANADAGLYVMIEFPTRRDYDLNLLHTDGSYAARARTFNTTYPTGVASTPGHGGEGTDTYEKLVGIRTADCGGWTLAAENHFGEGGNFDIKLWLGEAKIDPQPPGKETP